MSGLIERLLAVHRMLSREVRRESRKKHSNAARIARLRAERHAIKERVGRHAPKHLRAITFFRAVLFRLLRPGKQDRRTVEKEHP